MSQNPIIDRTPPPYRVSRVGSKITSAWRRLPNTESKAPECILLCPASQVLTPIPWSTDALCIFFSVNSQSYIRDAIESCRQDTRIYLLTTPEETDDAKKFAKGIEPKLRTLIRTTQHAGPCSVFTAKLGVSWNKTKAGKTWRLQLNTEQCAAYHERFLYTFWHESSSQHHLAGDTWVSQTGQAIESPFNAPVPTNEKLSLLANDESGLPKNKFDYLVSTELSDNSRGNLILTNRDSHTFSKLESLLEPGVTIKVNCHDIPTSYVIEKSGSFLIMQYGSFGYRLTLSSEQTEELIKWINSTDDWQFLKDVTRSTQPDYLNATFGLERGQDIIPGKEFPNGVYQKSLGTFKATDFIDFANDELRVTELPNPPELALITDYTWKIKPPELDESSKKVTEYNEWEKTYKAISAIKADLIRDYAQLTKELESVVSSDTDYKRSELGGAIKTCEKATTQLEELNPEKNNWKYGQAPADFDPFKILNHWSEFFVQTKALIDQFNAHKKWVNDIQKAEFECIGLRAKINDLEKEIEECGEALESKDNLSEHKAIKGKKQSLESDLEKKNAAYREKKKAAEAPAPAYPSPQKNRLAGRNDLVAPNRPLPTVGELFYSDKNAYYTLAVKYLDEIELAQKESVRLKKYYGKEFKIAKRPD